MIDYIRARFSGCTITAAHSAPVCVCVCFCLLTTCCTGMGCGAMGAGLHCVVVMVLFCQFWPPVSFFSPGWLQCISGLRGGNHHKRPNEHTLSGFFVVFAFTRAQPEANFSNDTKTLIWRGENVMFLLVDSTFSGLSFIFFYIPCETHREF